MNLLGAMRDEYRRGERLMWTGLVVKVAIYATTLVTSASTNGTVASVCLIFACVGQVFLFLSRISMRGYLDWAQRLRRLAMLEDGIGREPTPFETAALPERAWAASGEGLADPYYASHLPKGPKRLVDITSECAFFSGKLAERAWRAFLIVSIVASVLLF